MQEDNDSVTYLVVESPGMSDLSPLHCTRDWAGAHVVDQETVDLGPLDVSPPDHHPELAHRHQTSLSHHKLFNHQLTGLHWQ